MNKANNGAMHNAFTFLNSHNSSRYVAATTTKNMIIFIQSFDTPDIPV